MPLPHVRIICDIYVEIVHATRHIVRIYIGIGKANLTIGNRTTRYELPVQGLIMKRRFIV